MAHFDADLLHVVSDFVCQLLIETSKEYGSNHYGYINAQSMQETSTFETNVRGSHHQCFPRLLLHPENIVRRNSQFFHVFNFRWIRGSATSCNQNIVCSHYFLLAILISQLDFGFAQQLCQLVKVCHLVSHQCLPVPEVQRSNIIVDSAHHVLPIMFRLLLLHLPAHFAHSFVVFTQKTRVVHKLLRDAANIDTCTSKTPFGSSRRWLNKVSEANLATISSSPLCCSKASRAASNDEQLEVFGGRFNLHQEKYYQAEWEMVKLKLLLYSSMVQ